MIGQWEKLFTPSTPFLMTPSSGESIGLAASRIMRVFQANRSSRFVWRGFPRDFFSVANNLGDSVAFNLESDISRRQPSASGSFPSRSSCSSSIHWPIANGCWLVQFGTGSREAPASGRRSCITLPLVTRMFLRGLVPCLVKGRLRRLESRKITHSKQRRARFVD